MALQLKKTDLFNTIDEEQEKRKMQQERENARNRAAADEIKQKELERKQALFAYLQDPNAPTGVRATDYLDALSATGQMAAEDKKSYDAERLSKGEDPTLNYTAKVADKLVDQAKQNAENFQDSEEYEGVKSFYDEAFTINNWYKEYQLGNVPYDAHKMDVYNRFHNEYGGDLEAIKNPIKQQQVQIDYLQGVATNAKNEIVQLKDLKQLESWSAADRKDLDTYLDYTARGTQAMGLPALLSGATAALDRLNDKYGRETVRNIIESYTRKLNAQDAANAQKAGQQDASLGNALLSIPVGIAGQVANASTQAGQVLIDATGGSSGRYSGLNPNAGAGAQILSYTEAVQRGEAENVKNWAQNAAQVQGANKQIQEAIGKVAGTVYTAGMGALENITRVAMTGGVGSLALAGVGSFSLSVRDATLKGASADQAFALGLVNAASEVLTEKLPLDNLLGALKQAGSVQSFKQILSGALKQAGIEAATEEVNFLAGIVGEAIILQEKSDYNTMISNLVAQGVPYTEAVKQANKAIVEQAGQTALQAGLSGFMTSAGTSVATQVGNNHFTDVAQEYEGRKEQASERLQWLHEAIDNFYAKKDAGAQKNGQATQQDAQAGKLDITELVDGAIAKLNNAPADPVGAAVESFEITGTVSNKQANDILNSVKAVQQLVQEAGVKLDGLTKAQQRQAVKDAVQRMTQRNAQDESTSVNTDPKQHTQQEQAVIDAYQNAVDDNFVEYIQTVMENPGQKMPRYPLKNVDNRVAEDIKRLTGIDVAGNKTQIESRMVEHIIKDHGENGVTDRSMRDVNDIARIQYVIDNYDTIEHGGKSSAYVYQNQHGRNVNAQTVVMKKKVNGTYFVVEAVPDTKKKTVFVVSAYMSKDGTQKSAASLSGNAEATRVTSETATKNTADLTGAIAPSIIIRNNSGKVNTEAANENDGAEHGAVGAAEKGFSPKYEMIDQYGAIPEGENPTRVDQLPKSTNGSDRVSYTARTAMEASVTPDAFAQLIENETVKGGFSYIPIKNSETVEQAKQYITNRGWETALKDWTSDVRKGKAGSQITAVGALLYNNAVNSGDFNVAMGILSDYSQAVRNSAQALQAARILKTLTPENRLYMIRKSIDQMVNDMRLDTKVTIDEDLQHEYINAETEEARDEVITKIQKQVAAQLPATMIEKFTALRYVNMLGNFKTQIKNITGNLTMKAVRSLQNGVATSLETVANKLWDGKVKRTRSYAVSREQMKVAENDFDSVKSIMDGGKFNETDISDEFMKGVQKERRIFKLAPLEGYRKITNWAMEQGDIVFAKSAYARALAGYLKANGITETDYSKVDTEIMDDARLFAAKEAQEATFRDTNWLSGWVSKAGRRKDTPQAVKVISDGVMPFRKTPANVLVRAEEYSPLGIINSVVTSVKAMHKDSDVTATDVINSWSKTLTGTGIFGLGMLLQSFGLLSTGPDEDKGKEDFENLNGWQNYALTLPDGTNLTIDALSPSSIPLLMGAELKNLIDENGFQLKDLEKALTSIAQPMIEMSMLQGISDTLDNIQYAENNLGQLAINAAVSYLTQGLTNTLAGQLERTFEDSRMTTYVDKNSDIPGWLQRTIGKASAKTPGLDYNQIPYINTWGVEEESPHWAVDAAYQMLTPSYIEKGVSNEVTQELNRLNDAVSDVNVYPTRPDKTVKVNKEDYNLSADEYVELAKLQGQTQKKLVEGILSSESYGLLSDEEKAKAISFAYEYARGKARGEVVPEHPGIETKWMKALQGDVADGIIRHVKTGTTAKYLDISIESAAYISNILDGLTAQSGYTNVRDVQRLEAVVDAPKLSDKEQESVLRDIMGDALEKKFDKVLDMGISADDFVKAYRVQLDTEGDGKKAKVIKYYTDKLGLDKATAESLYKLYSGAK